MADYLILIPLLPLIAAIINLLLGRKVTRNNAHLVSVPAVAVSWVCSLLVLREIWNNDHAIEQQLFTWIPSGSFNVPVNLFADQLTAVMLMVVTTVSLLVHIYSIGYMKGDPGYYRFFAYLPLFVFSMLMLILADNFLMVFFGWEAVGLCSYLLIGYYYKRRSAGNAAKKAFIVNRIGDLGFGLGIMLIFWTFGTLAFWGDEGVFARVGEAGQTTITVIALLLFAGAVGKSAQFPLHVWLPDAMEGPTPVSALIHAATMVTAGIYLVARSNAIFQASTTAMFVVTVIGLLTAFMGASIAITQNDIKRIVAYSTVSQLGFMVFALGTGAWMAAIFHLMTHAFFKGLLFLGCGSVIHGMHEEQDIRKMGNLRKYMPITFWTFLIGSLANAGIFPLAGFWSKDEIIIGSWVSEVFPRFGDFVTIVALAAAFLTAFYMFRLVFKVFFGKENFDSEHVHPHESPITMTGPLVVLAIATVGIGFVGFPPEDGKFHHFTDAVFGHAHHVSMTMTVSFGIISSVVAIAGIFLAYLYYIRGAFSAEATATRFNGLYNFLYNRWGIDTLYQEKIVQPLYGFAMFLWKAIDVNIIDATVNGIARGTINASQRLRKVQTGVVSNYAMAIALGMIVIIGVYLVGFSSLDVPFLR